MLLFYSPATSSLAVHIALRAANATFDTRKVAFIGEPGYEKQASDETGLDFREVNPRAYVPALQLSDGSILTECPAILLYISESMRPENVDRYRLVELLSIISSELQGPIASLLLPDLPSSERSRISAKATSRLNWIAQALGDQPFLFGEDMSVADALLYTVLNWLSQASIDLNTWPKLKEYRKRMGQLPAVDAALRAEGLRKG